MDRRILTHEAAVKEVYRLTPQIREYDEFMYLGVKWLPYTMFFHHKNYQSAVINTDSLGFRYSSFENGYVGVADFPKDQALNLLVGASTVLGTGATTDAYTMSSRLAEYTGEAWLNFSGRGYNAVQELLLFLMHQHRFKYIKNVIVLSGLNTLALEGLPDNLTSDHGRYYYSYEYQYYMNKYNNDLKKRANTYASNLDNRNQGFFGRCKNYISRFLSEENTADKIITGDGANMVERAERAAWAITNALYQWKQLLAPLNGKLTFVLQPMAHWAKDLLTTEEQDIFYAIDSCPNNLWHLYGSILGKEIYKL